jgi:hypothetical protein
VSDTDEEKGGLLSGMGEADILSLRSGIDQHQDARLFGGASEGVQAAGHGMSSHGNNQLYQEIANQKIKYFKKIA